jgi:carbon-monoxide dehydrogenase iron sulfur subunit
MIVCSERHTGASSLTCARIRIDVDMLSSDLDAHYCRQCKKAPCAQACPEEAIRLHVDTGAWLVDEELCTGCGRCVEACPFHAVEIGLDHGRAVKCDLCGGRAWCVQSCPPAALSVRGRKEAMSDGQ